MKKILLLIITLIYCIGLFFIFDSKILEKYNLAASVNDKLYASDMVDNSNIEFVIKDKSLSKGQKEKIAIKITNKDKHEIKWTTSNKNVVELSSTKGSEIYLIGKETGKSAQITVTVDGTKEKSIRIAVRKKEQERFNINMLGEGNQDVMYSWWTYPLLINSGNVNYYGFTTSQGYIGVAKYDKNTKSTTQNYLAQPYDKGKPEIDDHNAPAVYKLPDNRILAAFSSGHAKNDQMHIRISKNANDITSFGEDIVLKSNGNTTYAQILNKNNKYYLFHRCGGVNNWCYFSTSNPNKWSNNDKTFIKAPGQYYMKLVDTTIPDLARFLITFNPTATQNDAGNIRMGFIDFKTGNVYDAGYDGQKGVMLGSINDTFNYNDFSIVLNKEKGKSTRLFDVAVTAPEQLEFAYCTWVSGNTYADYKIFKNGKKYTIVNGSYGFWLKYFGGISFINKNELVVSSGEVFNGDKVSIFKYNENTDKYISEQTLFKTNNIKNRAIRPIVSYNSIENGITDIMWLYGNYDYYSYNNFDMRPFFESYSNIADKVVPQKSYSTKNTTKKTNKKKTTQSKKNNTSYDKKSTKTDTNKVKKNNESIKENTTTNKVKPSNEQIKENTTTNKTTTNTTKNNTTTNASTNNNTKNTVTPNTNTNTNKNNTTTQQQTKPSVQPSVPTISIKIENASRALTAGQCNNNHLTFDLVDTSGANITKVEYKNSEHDFKVFDASNLSCNANRCKVTIRKNHKDMYIRVTNSRNQNQTIGKYTVCNIPMVVHNESTLKSGKCAKTVSFTVEDRSGAQISSVQYSNTKSNWDLKTTVSYNSSKTTATIVMKKSHNPIYFKVRNSVGVEQVFGPYKICIK